MATKKLCKVPSTKIRVGDSIIVLTGKDKGQTGKVLAIDKAACKVHVDGVNMVKKHTKANPQRGVEGGIVEKALPIHISNVALLNPSTKKAEKVGYKISADGKKERFFKSTQAMVEKGE